MGFDHLSQLGSGTAARAIPILAGGIGPGRLLQSLVLSDRTAPSAHVGGVATCRTRHEGWHTFPRLPAECLPVFRIGGLAS